MREFCKKDIQFSVIKLNNEIDKTIAVMKEHHQEVEVSEMARSTNNYTSSYSSYDACADMSVGMAAMRSDFGAERESFSMAMDDRLDMLEEADEACDMAMMDMPVKSSMKRGMMKGMAMKSAMPAGGAMMMSAAPMMKCSAPSMESMHQM